MVFLAEYGLFLLKALTIVFSLLILLGGVLALTRKAGFGLTLHSLNDAHLMVKGQMGRTIKGIKKRPKKDKKINKNAMYVIDFNGDMRATQVEQLRKEVTAVLSIAEASDEVVIRLESPGGAVNGYGLAASQLQRIRDRGIPLTVCIDKMAASGGYLMSCVANTIVAAPFAIVGSIGVVAQIPNVHRWLKKHNVDVELITAGEYKRTLTVLGENTEKGRQKFKDDLEKIHQKFRDYVFIHRPFVDIDAVSTGEHWLGIEAHALKLVDSLKTSDDYIIERMNRFTVYSVTQPGKRSMMDKLFKPASQLLSAWRLS